MGTVIECGPNKPADGAGSPVSVIGQSCTGVADASAESVKVVVTLSGPLLGFGTKLETCTPGGRCDTASSTGPVEPLKRLTMIELLPDPLRGSTTFVAPRPKSGPAP